MSETKAERRQQRRKRRLFDRMLRVTATAVALFPATLQADDLLRSLDAGPTSFGAGVFVGYQFGPRPGVEWGLEAFATRRFGYESCSSSARAGVGPLLQLGVMGTHDPRLTLALQGGGELLRTLAAVSGEVGLTYRFGVAPGFGIHLGIRPETLILNAGVSYQVLRDELWVGGGARFLPTYGEPGSCAIGRPLRTESGALQPLPALAELPCSGMSAASLAGHAYARDAQLECASVPAFLQLAAELISHDAPEVLVERALDAACDELVHAELCARLATQRLGQAVRPSLPVLAPRPALPGSRGLVRLAMESWIDGCLAEGSAAVQAAHAARIATDSEVRTVQAQIARDERRHAELAWSILGWASERGGEPLHGELRTALDTMSAAVSRADAPCGLERHGRVGPRALAQLDREHRDASVERLLASKILAPVA